MRKQNVYIFGNPDLEMDSLPIRLIPRLKQLYPDIDFVLKDPNEEWDIPEEMTIIDTAVGVDGVTVFDDLESFASVPRLSMHDYDALTNLRYMKKLGKLKRVKIIGVPPEIDAEEALKKIGEFLK
jgi:Ni,Fe-hydrogenase maturation factor